MTQWYEEEIQVTLTHSQWATVLLALWDSMGNDERDDRISERVKEKRLNEKLDIRDTIHGILPPAPSE